MKLLPETIIMFINFANTPYVVHCADSIQRKLITIYRAKVGHDVSRS